MRRAWRIGVGIWLFIGLGGTAWCGPLKAGLAKVDITPPPGLPLWGFESRKAPATGTRDPLYARVLVLEAGGTRLALVASDRQNKDHRSHARLGYVLQEPGTENWEQSEIELTRAIENRDRRRLHGWLCYEMKRAVARIHLDPQTTGPSAPDVQENILVNLRRACQDPNRRRDIGESREIQAWLTRNNLAMQDLSPA
jgi:hypothetical protein